MTSVTWFKPTASGISDGPELETTAGTECDNFEGGRTWSGNFHHDGCTAFQVRPYTRRGTGQWSDDIRNYLKTALDYRLYSHIS